MADKNDIKAVFCYTGFVLFILIFSSALLSFPKTVSNQEIKTNWEKSEATILDIEEKRNYIKGQKYHSDYTVIYRYENPDKETATITKTKTTYCPYSCGDKIEIYYNPDIWHESVIAGDM